MKLIDKKHKNLIASFVKNFQFRIFGLAISFLIVLLINRFFGVATYGAYALVVTITQICTLFITFGIPNTLIKVIGNKNYNYLEAKNLLLKGCKIVLLFAIFPMIFFYFGSHFLADTVFKNTDLYIYFLIIALSIPFFVVHEIFVYFFVATKKFFNFNLFFFVIPNILLIGFLSLFHFLGKDSYFTILAFSLSIFFTVLIEIITIFKWKSDKNLEVQSTGELLKTASPLFFSGFLIYLLNATSVVILGLMVNEKDLGIYNLAFKIANLGLLIIVSISTITTPKIARLFGENKHEELKITIQNATKLISILTIPLVLVVIIFNQLILSFFSSEAIAAGNILIILILGVLVNAMSGNGDQILNMTNNQHILRNITLICFVSNVMANVALISYYGILGAALAGLFTNLLLNFLCVYYIKKKLGFYTLF
ncbi:oligosaccharide flippase family protein [Flavobacterium anhuiense]|uniref:oligosaccharide flippase family protein n=1 Tax=Flavobacterium anhuiense TaxID=459526 RepID=UPI002025C521|nr:oligosaccharide flippase family protein [Flavobacterium anhuiense]URM37884.1 oligosaccharide flippase family protein [Flavobacterium anhuiense]